MQGNFHGRTITVISFSSEEANKADFGPYTPGFTIIPYGDVNALENAITENTAAFLVEPIQGEAGVRVPPVGYIRKAYEICKRTMFYFLQTKYKQDSAAPGKCLPAIGKVLSLIYT